MIELIGINKYFSYRKNNITALQNIDLKIDSGELDQADLENQRC